MEEEQTEHSENINRTIVMTVPKSYADKFLAETKLNFLDCRYLNLMFKDLMFTTLYNKEEKDIKDEIHRCLQELKKYRDEEIKGMAQQISYYKTQEKKRGQ